MLILIFTGTEEKELWGHLTPVEFGKLFFSVFIFKITIIFSQNFSFDPTNFYLKFYVPLLICKTSIFVTIVYSYIYIYISYLNIKFIYHESSQKFLALPLDI